GPLEKEIEKLEKIESRSRNDEAKLKKLRGRHKKLTRELKTTKRIEYTIQSEKGQDKGHAIVADNLTDDEGNEVDFICLDSDTKSQVRLTNGKKWVGINFVHGHDHMRLDIQSLIHLQEFLDPDVLEGYVQEEAKILIESLNSGNATKSMEIVNANKTIEEVQDWALNEFVLCGGDIRWSQHLTKMVANQHLKRLSHGALEKLRIPIPGGRFYVMPTAVGERAGVQLSVGRGEIKIDPEYGTAWVNDEDWLEMEDSPTGEGLASIWGGGDNDDALWIVPFTDYDGEKKILAWRSPNQLGEYAVLRPTVDSPDLALETIEEDSPILYPELDSRDLPERTDFRPPIESQIKEESASDIGQGEDYSVEAMEKVFERARINAGVVGLYCNSLMLHKAIFHTFPEDAPAPLEDVIDGAVKTGAELAVIKKWCIEHSKQILRMGVPIPKVLQERLAYDRDRPPDELVPPIIDTEEHSDHWMDLLTGAIAEDIKIIEAERDEMMANAAPPARLMDAVFFEDMQNPHISFDTLEAGAKFNQTYTYINKKINEEKQWNKKDNDALHETLREEILGMTPEERGWRLRQLIYEQTFKKVASQVDGFLGREDNEKAIRFADEQLERLIQQNRVEPELHKRLHWKGKIYHEKNKKKWEDEDHDRVRRRMLDHLTSYHPDTHKAILRAAMVSTYMNDKAGSDAAVWIPGIQSEDGRLPGIAEKTIEALREIDLLHQIDETEDGVITYPSEIISEPSYQSLGIKNAWFGWYQDYAAKNDLPVPQTYKEINKEKKRFARQEFKKAARNFAGQKIIIQKEKDELIAYTSDGIRLGPISDQSKAQAGQEIEIKGSFARSGDLRIAMDPPQRPEIPKEETKQPEQLELDLNLPEKQLSNLSKSLNQIPGIGPASCRKIIETFGDQALDIIKNEPERLLEIPGIGKKRVEKIIQQQ
ncbi:MAG: helix-hairpin-helix domain-containing protein, partial [Ardenticatenaceae bacterium]